MSYIRTLSTKNGIRYITSDYKEHINMNNAINYIAGNYDKLKDLSIDFDTMYYRKKKINKIIEIIEIIEKIKG